MFRKTGMQSTMLSVHQEVSSLQKPHILPKKVCLPEFSGETVRLIHFPAGGMPHVPGIWSQDQIDGWKKVTKAVHDKGGVIYLQMWALGRANPGNADVPKVVSASNIPFEGGAVPEPLTKEDIARYVQHYAQAARNSIEAGFDGVEIHSANGYTLQQFISKASNDRTDEYGGSLENRTRFVREVLQAVTNAVGQERTGIRWSPFGTFQGMDGKNDEVLEDYKCRSR